ncbi:MAG TPA: autotransporter domain-containing protein, partial [Thermodesulfobacteriota bacterium]|nr:autotransporter domain-containing protein [Thermodesulfobacteriota bacterium]
AGWGGAARAAAQAPPADGPWFRLETAAGWRTDRVDWNIADADGRPNVVSELTWRDLEIYQARLAATGVAAGGMLLRGVLGYGRIVHGRNQDSDFAGDNRTGEFSRSNNRSDDGSVLDASIGLGGRLRPGGGAITVTPLAGLSYHVQRLRITDGVQTVSDEATCQTVVPGCRLPPPGPIPGLDSTYEARWRGPFVGVELGVEAEGRGALVAAAAYHLAAYDAEANWNLREDFARPRSFTHEGDGSGVVLALTGRVAVAERWTVGGGVEYQRWRVRDGTDRVFFVDGTSAPTRLNEVNWESVAVSLGVEYRF